MKQYPATVLERVIARHQPMVVLNTGARAGVAALFDRSPERAR
jgi:hypothetical protein